MANEKEQNPFEDDSYSQGVKGKNFKYVCKLQSIGSVS